MNTIRVLVLEGEAIVFGTPGERSITCLAKVYQKLLRKLKLHD